MLCQTRTKQRAFSPDNMKTAPGNKLKDILNTIINYTTPTLQLQLTCVYTLFNNNNYLLFIIIFDFG